MPGETETVRKIEVREGLSVEAVRSLAALIKSQYIDAFPGYSIPGTYKETWSGDRSSVTLEWGTRNFTPGGGGVSPQSSTTRAEIGPGGVTVERVGEVLGGEAEASWKREADSVEFLVTAFLAKAKGTSLYFIFSAGGGPEAKEEPSSSSFGVEAIKRILSGNMMNLYLLIITASFVLFLIFGVYAIFAVLAIQLLALFYSDRLALMVGKVRPTAERPNVTVVSVSVSSEVRQLISQYAKGLVPEIRSRLEGRISGEGAGGPQAVKSVQETLAGVGIKASDNDIRFVTRDVYGIVERVAERFRLPVPKITIMNSVEDNAAATGVSPGRASISITVGSLEDLGDEELSSVIGHELGHILGRDSLILFCVTFSLYFGGLFLWYPLLAFLGLFYYLLAFAVIFGVGKVLETRADTESAVHLGEPGVLASALAKVGFRQLYVERYSSPARFFDWLRFDPHPPIYFRVQRLSKLAASGKKIGSPLLLSVKDCLMGFLRSMA